MLDQGQMYDAASTIMAQKLSQVQGVGQVIVGGSALPAVRVELNPAAAATSTASASSRCAAVLSAANANTPEGPALRRPPHVADRRQRPALQGRRLPAARSSATTTARPCASPTSAAVDGLGARTSAPPATRTASRAVLVIIFRQPGANIIDTVDRIAALLPATAGLHPAGHRHAACAIDRTTTIRASVRDVERTLVISIALVILVVFLFLRSPRATLIPSVAVPVSLIGTFGVMYLLRLQPRQPLADGADHLHRLRGGRRHRGDREHHAPPRKRHDAARRRAEGRRRDRLHRASP